MHTAALVVLAAALAALPARAERADRDKPVNVEADRMLADDGKQTVVFEGRVVLTQGTFVLRADKLTVRQDKEGFQSGVATGSPATFRQKRDGVGRVDRRRGAADRVRRQGRAGGTLRQGARHARQGRGARQLHLVRHALRDLPGAELQGTPRLARRTRRTRAGGDPAEEEGRRRRAARPGARAETRTRAGDGAPVNEPLARATLAAPPSDARPSRLRTAALNKRYKKRTVVRDVSLDVTSGEVVGLLGPNGAGKTTCFYMIVGLVAADGGRIFVDDRDITRLPIHRRARLGLSYLPQEASVFRRLTVQENVRAVLELMELGRRTSRGAARRAARRAAHRPPARRHRRCRCPGGERRRVEIAGRSRPARVHPARRAVRGRRPDRRAGHPAHHPVPQGTRDRGPDHRP